MALLERRYFDRGETVDGLWDRVSGGNERFRRLLSDLRFLPNSPTLFNAGLDNGCTLSADRKSTRLNSSHSQISYAVFCVKKKTTRIRKMLPKCKILLFSGQAATAALLYDGRRRGHDFEVFAKPVQPSALLANIKA